MSRPLASAGIGAVLMAALWSSFTGCGTGTTAPADGSIAVPGGEALANGRASVEFDLVLAQDSVTATQAAERGLVPRQGVTYPYDAAELETISVAQSGVRLGNDCVGDEPSGAGRERQFNVFLSNESGVPLHDVRAEIVSCAGATPVETSFDYGDVPVGAGGPGPQWDQVDGNEQVWRFEYGAVPLELSATVRVSWAYRIAFSTEISGVPRLRAVNSDGGNLTDLGTVGNYPAFSPDGSRIAFVSGNEICAIDSDGSDWAQLTSTGTPKWQPDWSPDGTKIVFQHGHDTQGKIAVVNADGTGLVTYDVLGIDPSWSPNGSQIVFSRVVDGRWLLHTASADGTDVTCLDVLGYACDWSPDGQWVAYSPLGGGVWLVRPDGSDAHALPAAESVGTAWYPTWSPDGSRLAFYSNVRDSNYELYTIGSDGSDLVRLTSSTYYDSDPDW